MDISHIPGLDLSGFFIPGNNGLPDLYVHANDPADWVTMQIAARTPVETPSVAAEATATAAETKMPNWLKSIEDVLMKRLGISFGDYMHGIAIAGIFSILAIALILLGAYQFTKD